jgi:hypothetical protein
MALTDICSCLLRDNDCLLPLAECLVILVHNATARIWKCVLETMTSCVLRLIEQAPFHPPTIYNSTKVEGMVPSNDSRLTPMTGKIEAVLVEAADQCHHRPLVDGTKETTRCHRSTNEAASRIAESRISNRSFVPLRVCHHVIKGASKGIWIRRADCFHPTLLFKTALS